MGNGGLFPRLEGLEAPSRLTDKTDRLNPSLPRYFNDMLMWYCIRIRRNFVGLCGAVMRSHDSSRQWAFELAEEYGECAD